MFENDRRLLETRGSLIIRQLCVNLNPEKMYRTMATIFQRTQVDIKMAHFAQ